MLLEAAAVDGRVPVAPTLSQGSSSQDLVDFHGETRPIVVAKLRGTYHAAGQKIGAQASLPA